jgi:hypothetical protein
VSTQQPPKSRRAIVAAVVLAPLPLPTVIDVRHVGLRLTFETVADGLHWASFLGTSGQSYLNSQDGNRYLRAGDATWHGWDVDLWAVDRPADELDPVDQAAVEKVAAS